MLGGSYSNTLQISCLTLGRAEINSKNILAGQQRLIENRNNNNNNNDNDDDNNNDNNNNNNNNNYNSNNNSNNDNSD